MKFVRSLIFVFVAAYVAIAVLAYSFQESLIFHPMPVDDDFTYKFTQETEDVWLKTPDGLLHGVLFKAGQQLNKHTAGLVIYFKGNMGNVGHSETMAKIFVGVGYDVLSMDYRGSGKSKGRMSEAALLKDAERWHDWAAIQYGSDIRLVGYSLGTTFASHVAGVRSVSHTILFAPMSSVLDIGVRRYPILPEFLARYPLRSDQKLAKAEGQVVIYHGVADRVIPIESSELLRAVLKPGDSYFRIEGADHYTIPYREEVITDIHQRWGNQLRLTRASSVQQQAQRLQQAALSLLTKIGLH